MHGVRTGVRERESARPGKKIACVITGHSITISQFNLTSEKKGTLLDGENCFRSLE